MRWLLREEESHPSRSWGLLNDDADGKGLDPSIFPFFLSRWGERGKISSFACSIRIAYVVLPVVAESQDRL
jgi:hypothetical protein